MFTHTLSPALHLRQLSDGLAHSWAQGQAKGYYWWLVHNNVCKAYAKTLFVATEAPTGFKLTEFETRPEFQKQGWARVFCSALETVVGETLYIDGGCTEAGLKAFAFLPVTPGFEREACFAPQNFVLDWANLVPKY